MSVNTVPRSSTNTHRTVTVRPPAAPVRPLRILAADPDPAARDFYLAALPKLGHQVQVVATGPDLVRACHLLNPDLVVAATDLPDPDGLAAAEAVCRERPVPVVLVAGSDDPAIPGRAAACEAVMSCLTRPVREEALGAAVALAARRFDQLRAARLEAAELKQALEDRKLVERAKGAVARRCGLGEDAAYRAMQAAASNANRKLVDVARQVLDAEAAYRQLEDADRPRPRSGPARHAGPAGALSGGGDGAGAR